MIEVGWQINSFLSVSGLESYCVALHTHDKGVFSLRILLKLRHVGGCRFYSAKDNHN